MKKWGIAGLVCVLFFCTGCGSEETGIYAEGMKALDKNDYYVASASFEASIQKQERLPEAYRGAGIAYLGREEYEKAEEAFANSLDSMQEKNDAFRMDVLFYTVQVKEALNKNSEALEICDEILKIREEPQAYFLKGRIYLSMDQEEKARECFDKAVKDNDEYDMYIDIFQAYRRYASGAEGEAFLERALKIENKDARDTYEKGRIYYYLFDYDNAKTYLIDAVNGGEDDAMLLLGRVYLDMDDAASARAMYQNYLNDKEKSAKAYNGLVLCDIAEGKYEQALEHVANGLGCKDAAMEQNLLYNEIVIYEYQQDFETARNKMTEYLAKYPEDASAIRENQFLQSR